MKRVFSMLFLLLILILPAASFAHGDAEHASPSDMMRLVEGRALGAEAHEEMESLMGKMLGGDMSDTEIQRMIELMNQNPGAHGMMMSRMMGMGLAESAHEEMMGSAAGTDGVWSWYMIVPYAVWLTVGILAIIWLGQKIKQGDKK